MKRNDSRVWIPAAAAAALVTLAAGVLAEPAADDWPQFRGHQRNGISPATGLLDTWPEGGPPEVWRRPIGEGYSEITVVGGRLYTMYAEPPAAEGESGAAPAEGAEAEAEAEAAQTEFVAAFDAAGGEEIWRTAIGERIVTEFGNGPRSTPTVDGDALYVLGAHGDLAALSTADGELRWKLELGEAFGTRRPHWGFATSTLVDGDLLVVESGGPEGKSYAGLDKATGEVRWTTGETQFGAGYNSPQVITLDGERRFLYVAGGAFRVIDADGKEVFSHPWPQGETHAMPIFLPPDRFFASGAEGIGATMMRIRRGDDGIEVEEVWKNRLMRNHFSSSILHGGHIYGFDNATLKCISAETGEQTWAKRGFGKGSLIYADGHLLVLSDRGKLVQVEATPEGYVEKGSVQALEGRSWTAPSLAGGRLYLRNHAEMVSYDLKG